MGVAAYPDPQLVVDTLSSYMTESATFPARIDGQPRLLHRPWSTLYFISVRFRDATGQLVVKIAHFPDQTEPEISWQSEELLLRGRREFETLLRVYDHFSDPPEPMLGGLRPRAYLPQINAVVMDFAAGKPLYDGSLVWRRLATSKGQRRAEQLMALSGQWLRRFHKLPLTNPPQERCFAPANIFQDLLKVVDNLQAFGVNPNAWPLWKHTTAVLEQITDAEQVWTHGDFHLRNVLVQPNGGVLGFDTAMERIDSPCFDLGKFIADLKTRRETILRFGLFPTPTTIVRLEDSFIRGYSGGQSLPALALYEGFFIFQKWFENIDRMQKSVSAIKARAVRGAIINPTFSHIVERWMQKIAKNNWNVWHK